MRVRMSKNARGELSLFLRPPFGGIRVLLPRASRIITIEGALPAVKGPSWNAHRYV